ncbi:MAG: transglutaminase domain-containing protein, partial [Chloroflexota bacterium]
REIRIRIESDSLAPGYLVSPQTVARVDQPARVILAGSSQWFASVDLQGGSDYTVTALVPVVGDVPGGITENRLRVASRDYTPDVRRLYLDVPDGTLGSASLAIFEEVSASAPDNPFDQAKAFERYLLSPSNFRYDTDVQAEVLAQCSGLSTVECFSRTRVGYCQYYATTMAMLLRHAGIPTRLAQGFLKGDRGPDGTEIVKNSAAHAWVEVLFPGYGWVDFDPTGGGVGQPVPIPSGAPATPTPRPSFGPSTPGASFDEGNFGGGRQSFAPGQDGGTTGGDTSGGPFAAIAVLLAIGGLALGSVVWRRGQRPIAPESAWGSVAKLAARFGFGPRPSQTVFEFAGSLGDELPLVRPELLTVAQAKVEVAYGRRDLGDDQLRGVTSAYRRLRTALLRLAFRRGRRGKGSGPGR